MLTQPFAEALAEAEQIIAGAPHVKSERDLAEGHDYLAGSIQASLRLAWAYQRDFPYFVQSTGPYTKMGLDNPDTLYFHAYLRDDAEYVVTGTRGTHRRPELPGAQGRLHPRRGARQPERVRRPGDRRSPATARFEFRLGPGKARARATSPSARARPCSSCARCTATGPPSAAAPSASTGADQAGCAPPPATDTATAAKRYAVAGKLLLSRLRTFLAFPEWFYLNEPVNTLTPPRATPGGLATQFSSAGHFDLADDEAMIVTVPAAAKETAPYQGIQLGSMWYVSLDYINHQTSLTADQARIDPDGRMRFVISERNPGVANWLELTGHGRGYVQLRWQRLTRDLGPDDGPDGRGRPVRRTPGTAAVPRQRAGVGTPVAGAHRRPPGRDRREDARADAAADKVVVVAGVGPGLGRSIALASAREGADVVLAARTAARLDEVAKEVDRARTARAGRPHRPGGRRGGGTAGGARRTTRSGGWTRWSTTRWRCRRSRNCGVVGLDARAEPASTPTSSPRCG